MQNVGARRILYCQRIFSLELGQTYFLWRITWAKRVCSDLASPNEMSNLHFLKWAGGKRWLTPRLGAYVIAIPGTSGNVTQTGTVALIVE